MRLRLAPSLQSHNFWPIRQRTSRARQQAAPIIKKQNYTKNYWHRYFGYGRAVIIPMRPPDLIRLNFQLTLQPGAHRKMLSASLTTLQIVI